MRVVDVRDFGPIGFRWLTLKRISVSLPGRSLTSEVNQLLIR